MPHRCAAALVVATWAALCVAREAPAEPPLVWDVPTGSTLPLATLRDERAGSDALFVAHKAGGLAVWSLAVSPPVEVARLAASAFGGLHVVHLAQRGDRLFVALGDPFALAGSRAGLAVVDVADPAAPAHLDQWTSSGVVCGASDVEVSDAAIYLGAMGLGVVVLTFDGVALREETTVVPGGGTPSCGFLAPNVRGLFLAGDRLYVGNDGGGLVVLDASAPTAPVEIGAYANPALGGKPQAYNHVVVDGALAYAAVDYCGLEILDVADPAAIAPVGWWNPWGCETPANVWFDSPGHANEIALDAARRRVVLSAGDSEVLVVDVSDPANPALVDAVGAPGNGRGVWGVELEGNVAVATYIVAAIPFQGGVNAVRAFDLPEPAAARGAVAALGALAWVARARRRVRSARARVRVRGSLPSR
ncbi:MAG: hypothetical protein KC560_02375 [Myxococcales bacterium]|nr:hypothetical protein [Myxococcales bacterium]